MLSSMGTTVDFNGLHFVHPCTFVLAGSRCSVPESIILMVSISDESPSGLGLQVLDHLLRSSCSLQILLASSRLQLVIN